MDSYASERYDRQIRLWGHHGQSKFSKARVCLINANSLGTEILKGLCLAGIGSYVILDSHKLTPEDVGCSFIHRSCIGKSRGESVKLMLSDLNEEVVGDVIPLESHLPHVSETKVDSDEDVNKDLEFWKQFNCVIACGFLYTDQISRMSKFCWSINVPLVICKSIGFFGSARFQYNEHLIIETHPDNPQPEFNMDSPFDDLKEYLDSVQLDGDSSILDKVSSYPYIVIIYKYLKIWQEKHNYPSDRLPNCFAEKRELKSIINEALRTISRKKNTDGNESSSSTYVAMPFENFLEASKAVSACLSKSDQIPDSVQEIFNHLEEVESLSQGLSRFWMIIKAIKEFVFKKNAGKLPLSGCIPDMTSSSEEYIRLQNIFKKRSDEDITSILAIIRSLQNTPSNRPSPEPLQEEIKLICKNIRQLQMMSTEAIYKDYKPKSLNQQDDDDDMMAIGICLKSLDLFFSTFGRIPGYQNDQVEIDIGKLKECVKQIYGKASSRLKTLDQCLYEVCRCGGAELHATSAFMGGCIAQEVIKLVTNQYVPVNDSLIYNAMTANTRCFKFKDLFSEE